MYEGFRKPDAAIKKQRRRVRSCYTAVCVDPNYDIYPANFFECFALGAIVQKFHQMISVREIELEIFFVSYSSKRKVNHHNLFPTIWLTRTNQLRILGRDYSLHDNSKDYSYWPIVKIPKN